MLLRIILSLVLINSSLSLINSKDPARCGFPGIPLHGSKDSHLRHVGSIVRFKCKPGYVLNGSYKITCLSNQTWSDKTPKCQPVSCGTPPNPDYSEHIWIVGNLLADTQTYNYGAKLFYRCEEGYKLKGSQILKCGADRKWHGVTPSCVKIRCPKHEQIENGITISPVTPFYNTTVQFKCNEGYNLLYGTSVRRCRKDGTWSGVEPRCNGCAKVDDKVWIRRPNHIFQFGILKGKERSYVRVHIPNKVPPLRYSEEWIKHVGRGTQHYALVAEKKTYSDEVFVGTRVLAGQVNSTLLHMGTVTKITEDEDDVDSWIYEVKTKETVANYTLGQLRTLHPPYFCVTCSDPGSPSEGYKNKDLEEYIPGMQVVYTCEYNSKLIGQRIITCQTSGQWSHILPICKAFRCDYLDVQPPKNGTRLGSDFSVGGVVEFACDHPLILLGEKKITCTENGYWSASPPVCKGEDEVKCSQMKCELWEKCVITEETNQAKCVCRTAMECPPLYKPVCGKYNGTLETYNNLCIMKAQACRENVHIVHTADDVCYNVKKTELEEAECSDCQMQDSLKTACIKPLAAFIGKLVRYVPADGLRNYSQFEVEIRHELPQGTRKTAKRITLAVEDKQGVACRCPAIPIKEKFLLLSNNIRKTGRSEYVVLAESTFVKPWNSQLREEFKQTCTI